MKMKMMKRIGSSLMVVTALVAVAGCAKEPAEQIEAATQALQQAESAGSAEYAPESFSAAKDAAAELDAELKVQEEKFGLFRSYSKATELAEAARSAADKAAADAASGKEQARNEASTLLAEARTALEEVRKLLAEAPRGKGTQFDIAAMKADLEGVEAALGEVEGAFQEERYLDAKAKAQAAKDTAEQVRSAILTARQARQEATARRAQSS